MPYVGPTCIPPVNSTFHQKSMKNVASYIPSIPFVTYFSCALRFIFTSIVSRSNRFNKIHVLKTSYKQNFHLKPLPFYTLSHTVKNSRDNERKTVCELFYFESLFQMDGKCTSESIKVYNSASYEKCSSRIELNDRRN